MWSQKGSLSILLVHNRKLRNREETWLSLPQTKPADRYLGLNGLNSVKSNYLWK